MTEFDSMKTEPSPEDRLIAEIVEKVQSHPPVNRPMSLYLADKIRRAIPPDAPPLHPSVDAFIREHGMTGILGPTLKGPGRRMQIQRDALGALMELADQDIRFGGPDQVIAGAELVLRDTGTFRRPTRNSETNILYRVFNSLTRQP